MRRQRPCSICWMTYLEFELFRGGAISFAPLPTLSGGVTGLPHALERQPKPNRSRSPALDLGPEEPGTARRPIR
jgi:hypothetical protein